MDARLRLSAVVEKARSTWRPETASIPFSKTKCSVIFRSLFGVPRSVQAPGHPRYSPPRRTSPPRRFASPRPLPSRSASRRARTFSRARLPPPPPPPFAMAAHFQEDERVPDECENCGAVDGLALCSRCHSAHFCSRKCQKAYWPFHREWCRRNDFAEAVEKTQPKFARFLRKHGKQAAIKDGADARPPSPPVPPPASLSILGRFAFAAPSRVLEPDDERVPEPNPRRVPNEPNRTEPPRPSAPPPSPRRGRPARA